ncbi:MAG: glucose-1-phosphate adenylyltransferase subunit GlgD [Vallitaleaceae bacterium]|nr:glucose-1-phosphate adenylyltransferase subunit GlgD [Vallitaleaceae bacterium]
MHSTLGIITTGGRNEQMKDLSAIRSVSATAFGGRYRAIDFVLSNMVNSGINKVGVVTQYSYRSLMDHLGSGKEWDLDRRNGGLFFFPPYLEGVGSGWYRGTADGMYSNMSFLRRSTEDYVLIATGNCIYKTNYTEMLENHIETGADISLLYRNMNDINPQELPHYGIVQLDEKGCIADLREKPLHPIGTLASLGVYILKRTLLMELLEEAESHGHYDFVKDIFIKKIGVLNMCAYEFKGYWRSMSSIPLVYNTNMDLLNPAIRKELFDDDFPVFTKVKDETPSKFNEEAKVSNSIIADGCIIEGIVENSVLFRGVKVAKGTHIKDSIIMQDTVVEENANLQYVILDKEVVITAGKELKGEETYPMVVSKGSTI